jgi:hypothetical protein
LKRRAFIDYTNYRGERSWREVYPVRFWYGHTPQHPRDGWLMTALTERRGAVVERDFAMSGIHAWSDTQPDGWVRR